MIKNLYFVISILLLTSCASTSVQTLKKETLDKPYSSVLVLCIESDENVKQFDKANYIKYIQGEFNSFEESKYRDQLEKTIKRNLVSDNGFPNVITSGAMFKMDELYSYEEFQDRIKNSGCQSILLVNLKDYWTETKYVTDNYESGTSYTRERNEPNFNFYSYLFDAQKGGNYLWTANIVAEGIYAGYDTLNNHMARRLSNKLKKDKMVY
ncbi:hypothetical protein [Labilibacter marinus]|uniref:hypothetical protein n=1 Tax=Labilibacter marinus TaxID=1477105 RepID=UPI0008327604|nr:hypothetical protein [Labilibacter marinus]